MQPDLQALSVYVDENYVNFQEAGKHNKNKLYIQLKSSPSRKYVVRTNKDNKKYITSNGKKVFLQSIRGQYKYAK
jgi:hypothetical protein